MPAEYKELTAYLRQMGIESIPHSQKNYLAHLVAVYHLMQRHELDEELCRAGLFHSIYGTEKFQGFKLPLDRREELAGLIGLRAERLAYWNCLMDRATLDSQLEEMKDRYLVVNRETGEAMQLTPAEYEDLCCVHLFDWLEQAPRSRFGMDYRRDAYRAMAQRLGGAALIAYDEVFVTR